MRIACGLVLFLAATTTLWGQMEPCLAGADSPDCGIKVVVAPPPEPPDENVIWAPSEVTIDVPLRMHPTKIQLNAGPAGTEAATFKSVAATTHYKKVGNVARFQVQIKSCPEGDNLLVFNIVSPRLPYPLAANPKLFECKQKTIK